MVTDFGDIRAIGKKVEKMHPSNKEKMLLSTYIKISNIFCGL